MEPEILSSLALGSFWVMSGVGLWRTREPLARKPRNWKEDDDSQ